MDVKLLISKAIQMRKFSYCPYSGFAVGSALLTKTEKLYTGCNIENASYTPCCCAERTAFFKAISEGEREFKAIAIAGGRKDAFGLEFCPPCGVCRQVMMEFCNYTEFKIILAKSEDVYKIFSLEELFPMGFGPNNLT